MSSKKSMDILIAVPASSGSLDYPADIAGDLRDPQSFLDLEGCRDRVPYLPDHHLIQNPGLERSDNCCCCSLAQSPLGVAEVVAGMRSLAALWFLSTDVPSLLYCIV